MPTAAIIIRMRRVAAVLGLIGLLVLPACLPPGVVGTLAPTLTIDETGGRAIAMQNGMPVPSFDWQPGPRIDLDGRWRFERADLDVDLTMQARDETVVAQLEANGEGRHVPDHDDVGWPVVGVPGTFNPPPDAEEGGAWYRTRFGVPVDWAGRAVTLKFASVNYVADVWLNGQWLGYHEGGTTPFAFDVGAAVVPGGENVLAVRVHTIPLGSRADILPWGLIDWWNYGGVTGPVWLEATPAASIVRADVVTHLDAVELNVVMRQAARLAGTRGEFGITEREPSTATLTAQILPATVDDDNLLDPDPRSLVADPTQVLVSVDQEVPVPTPGRADVSTISLQFGEADLWSPASPALYVVRLELRWNDRPLDPREQRQSDVFWTTFGIRHVTVDPLRPRVLLNGEPIFFQGVGLHAETLLYDADGELVSGTPAQRPAEVLGELLDARLVGADLIRAGHQPADPIMLMLADRLGFAVWEEIPLYHATPFIFERTMARGIPQQMLREMALRDMNRASVLFHGFANESTGDEERTAALAELHEIDRAIDGTRLTGQAAYGWRPDDPTHAPLDVAGFTFYHGVFYGDEPGPGTRQALREAHATHPDKPIMVLEFGRWADQPADEAAQRIIFEETYEALRQHRADEPNGYVSAATWWTLHDFATQIAGIRVEDFGLLRPDGTLRPAGEVAVAEFDAPAGQGIELALEPELARPRVQEAQEVGDWALVLYLGYALALSLGIMGAVLLILTHRGGRAARRTR